MKQKIFRTISLLAGVLGIAVAMLAAPQAANADSIGAICETSGSFCIGAPTLATDAAVTETASGRTITIMLIPGTSAQFQLKVNAAPSLCVSATNNDVNAVLHACNGGSGNKWRVPVNANGHLQFQNILFGTYLAGRDNGSQFAVRPLGVAGFFYNFDQA